MHGDAEEDQADFEQRAEIPYPLVASLNSLATTLARV
jgi:hypothetical protein